MNDGSTDRKGLLDTICQDLSREAKELRQIGGRGGHRHEQRVRDELKLLYAKGIRG